MKTSWDVPPWTSWQLGCKPHRGQENKDSSLFSMFIYRLPHLAPCWSWRLSSVSSRDSVFLCGGLTLASSQPPSQPLCHSSSPQAAWKYLLHCSPLRGLQGNLCFGTWSTRASNAPSTVKPLMPSHRASTCSADTSWGPHTLKQELKFSSLFSATTLKNLVTSCKVFGRNCLLLCAWVTSSSVNPWIMLES